MHPSPLTDEQWLEYIRGLRVQDNDLKSWFMREAGRGQSYYVNRIAQLGLRGTRVLDAGCGMGNWSMGLSRLFDEVYALEIDPVRLSVVSGLCHCYGSRLHGILGTVEALPFPDSHFDAVYCNGVIFLTRFASTLREFKRVLKPEGQLYLTFNGEAWWHHLILERGPREPVCIFYGSNGLLSVLIRALDELDIEGTATDEIGGQARRILTTAWQTSEPERAYRSMRDSPSNDPRSIQCGAAILDMALGCLASLDGSPIRRRLAHRATHAIKILTSPICDIVQADLVTNYRRRVINDLASRFALKRTDYELTLQTHSFEPDEMVLELRSLGFGEIVVSWEGTLRLVNSEEHVPPIYDRSLGVYECLARLA